MVSIHSSLNVGAQNSALSQSRDGDAKQDTEQEQHSEQNGQVVSGDSSIASGNGVLCQEQDNSDGIFEEGGTCVGDKSPNPPTNRQTAALIVTVDVYETLEPIPGLVNVYHYNRPLHSPSDLIDDYKTFSESGSTVLKYDIPVGDGFGVSIITPQSGAVLRSETLDCLNHGSDTSCSGEKEFVDTFIHITFGDPPSP
jgi:hypothetical protein